MLHHVKHSQVEGCDHSPYNAAADTVFDELLSFGLVLCVKLKQRVLLLPEQITDHLICLLVKSLLLEALKQLLETLLLIGFPLKVSFTGTLQHSSHSFFLLFVAHFNPNQQMTTVDSNELTVKYLLQLLHHGIVLKAGRFILLLLDVVGRLLKLRQ